MGLKRTGTTSRKFDTQEEANRRGITMTLAYPEHRIWRVGCELFVELNGSKGF